MIILDPLTEESVLAVAQLMREQARPPLHVLQFLAACEPYIVDEPVSDPLAA